MRKLKRLGEVAGSVVSGRFSCAGKSDWATVSWTRYRISRLSVTQLECHPDDSRAYFAC